MKKFLSVVLTLMMVFSVFTTVSAATIVDDISAHLGGKQPFLIFNKIDYPDFKIDVTARRSGTEDAYTSADLDIIDSSLPNGIGVDFKAKLDMSEILNMLNISNFLSTMFARDDAKETALREGKVVTNITVTITGDLGSATAADKEKGSLTDDNGIFVRTNSFFDPNPKKWTVEFENSELSIGDLYDNKTNYLSDLTFTLADVVKYSEAKINTITVKLTGDTTLVFGADTPVDTSDDGQFVIASYETDGTYTFTTNMPGSSGGGTSRYTLTYETNGGSSIDKETYARNTEVKLTKVPKKEGYIFEGWYLDKELTQRVTEVKMTKNITVYAGWVEDNGIAGGGYDTPEKLNGDDHFAYIVGYPEGDVRPGNNITRAEVTTIFFRLLKENERNMNLAYENSFSDVEILDWYNTAVSTMAKLGIVNGRNAESFDPNAFITRAEFAAICARFADTAVEAENKFTDVAGHWAEKEIYEAAEYGWIRGYEDNTFRPDRFITRAEAMTMINRVLNRIPETANDLLDTMKKWSDNSDEAAWYYIPVQEATNSHDYDKKNHIYEKWTSLNENFDWTKYEQ